MPNGDPNFDFKELESWFQPIAAVVVDFAERRNLLLDKYYHGGHDWTLHFAHTEGGDAQIALLRDCAKQLVIGSAWSVNSFESFKCYAHISQPRVLDNTPNAVEHALEAELHTVTQVEFGDWTKISDGYEDEWGKYTEEEFNAMCRRYPVPRLD